MLHAALPSTAAAVIAAAAAAVAVAVTHQQSSTQSAAAPLFALQDDNVNALSSAVMRAIQHLLVRV
jgi:hypothetical protein